jgi:hypothetical protein
LKAWLEGLKARHEGPFLTGFPLFRGLDSMNDQAKKLTKTSKKGGKIHSSDEPKRASGRIVSALKQKTKRLKITLIVSTNVLSFMPDSAKCHYLELHEDLFGPLKQLLSELQNF